MMTFFRNTGLIPGLTHGGITLLPLLMLVDDDEH
jgi:hypothetical protein